MDKFLQTLIILSSLIALISCSPGVTNSDITRACTIVGNTPQYLVDSTFANEYYKLEDLAGRNSSASALLLDLKLSNMKLSVMTGEHYSFQSSCEASLKEEFLD